MTLALVGLLASALAGGQFAAAAPAPSLAEVQRRVDALQHQAEQATEAYNETQAQLSSLQVRVYAAKTRLAQQKTVLTRTRAQLGQLAADLYRQGELSSLDLFLGDNPDSALTRAGLVSTIGDRRAQLVQKYQQTQAQLAQDAAQVSAQEQSMAAANAKLRQQRTLITAKTAEAQAQLDRLKASQRAALQRANRAQQRKSLSQALGRTVPAASGSPVGMSCSAVGVQAPNGRVAAVLAFACAQLGDPYQWAASGPNSYDCSGLTMAAWRHGGVSLPHSSSQQAGYGTRIPISALRPGDLVFFYSPISHVGIYLGHGLMIHAPHTGDVVRVAAMYSSPVAAVRL